MPNMKSRSSLWTLWPIAPWAAATVVLSTSAVMTSVSDEMAWTAADFAVAGLVLFGACGVFELARRRSQSVVHLAANGAAAMTALVLIWLNLALGIIGSEDNPANLMYWGVLALAVVGACLARFQPLGVSRALTVAAVAQVLAGAIALVGGLGSDGANWPGVIVALTAIFAAMWLGSAWLFRKAAQQQRAVPQRQPDNIVDQ